MYSLPIYNLYSQFFKPVYFFKGLIHTHCLCCPTSSEFYKSDSSSPFYRDYSGPLPLYFRVFNLVEHLSMLRGQLHFFLALCFQVQPRPREQHFLFHLQGRDEFSFFFFKIFTFWPCRTMFGISVPKPGIEPAAPHWSAES